MCKDPDHPLVRVILGVNGRWTMLNVGPPPFWDPETCYVMNVLPCSVFYRP